MIALITWHFLKNNTHGCSLQLVENQLETWGQLFLNLTVKLVYSIIFNLIETAIDQKFHQQLKCESLVKCVAYTFEQSKLICILHSSIDMGLKFTRGKQIGIKKTDYILSLPEVSFCAEKNRKKRCRREPKCQHIDCLRNALERYAMRPQAEKDMLQSFVKSERI